MERSPLEGDQLLCWCPMQWLRHPQLTNRLSVPPTSTKLTSSNKVCDVSKLTENVGLNVLFDLYRKSVRVIWVLALHH